MTNRYLSKEQSDKPEIPRRLHFFKCVRAELAPSEHVSQTYEYNLVSFISPKQIKRIGIQSFECQEFMSMSLYKKQQIMSTSRKGYKRAINYKGENRQTRASFLLIDNETEDNRNRRKKRSKNLNFYPLFVLLLWAEFKQLFFGKIILSLWVNPTDHQVLAGSHFTSQLQACERR